MARAAVTALANHYRQHLCALARRGVFGGSHGVTGRECHRAASRDPSPCEYHGIIRAAASEPLVAPRNGRMPNTTHLRFPSNVRSRPVPPTRAGPSLITKPSSHLRPNDHVPRRDCSPRSPRSTRRAPLILHKYLTKGFFIRRTFCRKL